MHHASAERIMQGGELGAILLWMVAGIRIKRQMSGLNALAEANPEIPVDLLEPLFAGKLKG